MTKIESDQVEVDDIQENVFSFLSNLNNYENLMPSQVSEWWSTEDEAKMKIQGLGTLHLKKDESREFSYLKFIPIGPTPVDLFLECNINQTDGKSGIQVVINADLNIMMRMVAIKPLQNLANFMVARVITVFKKD